MLSKSLAAILTGGILIIMLLGCTEEPPKVQEPAAPPAAAGLVVLGKVSDKPSEKIAEYQPLADYLAANLENLGINTGKVKVAPDLDTMAQWLIAGTVDLFLDNPYAAILLPHSLTRVGELTKTESFWYG